jgi:hypothetical protein
MVMCLARSHTQGAIFDAPEFANSIHTHDTSRQVLIWRVGMGLCDT